MYRTSVIILALIAVLAFPLVASADQTQAPRTRPLGQYYWSGSLTQQPYYGRYNAPSYSPYYRPNYSPNYGPTYRPNSSGDYYTGGYYNPFTTRSPVTGGPSSPSFDFNFGPWMPR